ncbi:DNA-binding CsgD family transcriptional regulator [Arthrobacter sp. AG258]|uniref:helix-turn-helix transcriptional regulator n=1 Tax=Arthrobacter sp. AG258 TaxID=2183899 RepID=UPI00105D3515|nr:helix-turn-helix transcriptional regulator [Arthrobacter sp. AG258]TDT76136.1 DNA-binding CsgD family transcriptional regulator [Arthrobacter sp. AG258]
MWEERAERARREIAALATDGLDLSALYAAALALVRQSVPFDQACWAGVDPDTMVMNSVTNWRPWPVTDEYAVRFAQSEYQGNEPNTFAQLMGRPRPVARISDAPGPAVAGSIRINDLLRPLGLVHELRGAFRVDQSCWGVGSLFRNGAVDFSDREVEFLAAVTGALAAATRIATRAHHAVWDQHGGPIIVLAGDRGELRAATPAATTWLQALEDAVPGRFSMVLYAVVEQAKASRTGTARTRMRDLDAGWVVLQASRLLTGDDPGQMVVTVEPATTGQLLTLLLAAYGFTPREQEVCLELIAGSPDADISRHLFISPHTVHDHLKSIFDKVGVGSRGELVARLTATG